MKRQIVTKSWNVSVPIVLTILPFHFSDANKRREWQLVETTTAEHDGDSLYQSWISIIPSYRQMSVFFLPRRP